MLKGKENFSTEFQSTKNLQEATLIKNIRERIFFENVELSSSTEAVL